MNLLSKETLIGAASLGAGAVAAKIVHSKVVPLIPVTALQSDIAKNLLTLGVGIFTPVVVKSNIGKGLGAGMIAVSVAGLVSPLLANAGITGNDTFMGDVLMGEAESGTLMGASNNIFDAPSNDYTSGDAGEMDY
jgi:acetyl/propionyl-CoA carboxylase alpha subunit